MYGRGIGGSPVVPGGTLSSSFAALVGLKKTPKHMRFHIRAAGQRAWESPNSGLPAHYRRIISLIAAKTSCEDIFKEMACHPTRQVQNWLDELQTLCFIELKRETKASGVARRRRPRDARLAVQLRTG
jgi:hypothetical protein